MSYQDIEERKKRKKQFAKLYIITVVVIISISTAFLIPPQIDKAPLAVKQTTTSYKGTDATEINEQWLALQLLWSNYVSDENSYKAKDSDSAFQQFAAEKRKFESAIDSLEENISTTDTTLTRLIHTYRNLITKSFVDEPELKNNDLSNNNQLAELQLQIKQKNEQIQRLKQAVAKDVRPATNVDDTESDAAKDAKFLSWALSSQSNELSKLRKENADLKARMNDLRKNK
jgi:chromosome segregation ATPase